MLSTEREGDILANSSLEITDTAEVNWSFLFLPNATTTISSSPTPPSSKVTFMMLEDSLTTFWISL
jgi:hypothetical protein